MLTFEEKLAIIESFPELERKDVSLGRVNFQYDKSALDKKNVVYHLHPNGNGFVYAAHLRFYKADDKGMVNIRDYSEDELRIIVEKSIHFMTAKPQSEEAAEQVEEVEETWTNRHKHTLILLKEHDDVWNVYAGENLDGTFNTYEEAAEYLDEEGFSRKK